MKDVLDKIFTAVLEFLVEESYVKLEDYFVDGTKIEANANRYTFVWKKSVDKQQVKLEEKVRALFAEIEEQELLEEATHAGKDLPELGEPSGRTSTKLKNAVAKSGCSS